LASARQAGGAPLSLVAADAARLPFADETFDAVAGCELVEHLVDVEDALSELERVTRIGGLVVLRSPALASPIWPVLDLPRLLLSRGGRPPYYANLRQAARFFGANLWRSMRAVLGRGPRFEPREPELSEARVGGDRDAAYWSSTVEIARHLARRGFRILQRVDSGPPWSPSWLVDRLAPWLSPTLAIVARRERR
jgi:SAM-dependent methyltransferase